MKSALLPLVTLVVLGCSEQIIPTNPVETDTYLVCTGLKQVKLFGRLEQSDSRYFTVTKLDGKVIKVKSNEGLIFSLEKAPSDPKIGGLETLQLLVESENLILRTSSSPTDKRDIVIHSNGTYKREGYMFGAEGRCEVRQKAF